MISTAPRPRKVQWYHPRAIGRSLAMRPRVYLGALAGITMLILLPAAVPAAVREAMAWCLGGAVYLAIAFLTMRLDGEKIRIRAARQDDGAVVILVVILLAAFSSLSAIFGLLIAARSAAEEAKLFFVALAALTIVISWMVTQVVFTLHYAHVYYAPHHYREQGLNALTFPGDKAPDYWDFFYFATSLGAASQTADVVINSQVLRRLTTLHAVVSFFFNTMVLALTINLAASLV